MLVNAANHFVAKGDDVSVILMKPGGEYLGLLDSRVKIIYFASLKKMQLLSSLTKILRKEKFDLLFTATPSLNTFTIVSRFISGVKTKIVISERNNTIVFFKNSSLTLSKLTFISIPLVYRFADAIVAVSKGLGDSLRKVALVSADKIHVIHNPAWSPDLENQTQVSIKHKWFDVPDIPLVITVGRLVPAKNQELLIDAIAALNKKKKVNLLIIGDGILKETLQLKIEKLNMQNCISLEGFKIDPVAWISHANLFVLSSDYEGFGNVLVEALAAGTTIVSTNCDYGPSEILEDRFGYLVPPNDVEALVAKIEYALDNPIGPELLKKRAREFGADNIMRKYEKLFTHVIS